MTFKEIYESIDPSPKSSWIKEIAAITKKSDSTVRMWLSGRQSPDNLTRSIISKELNIPEEELFPKRDKNG